MVRGQQVSEYELNCCISLVWSKVPKADPL